VLFEELEEPLLSGHECLKPAKHIRIAPRRRANRGATLVA
jgi:hypothetical protein